MMKRPTAAEVVEYASTIGFNLNGEYFVDYWEARGWVMKGGTPMKSWQATIRNWKRMDADRKAAGGPAGPAPSKSQAEIRREEAEARKQHIIEEYALRIATAESWLRVPVHKRPPFASNAEDEKAEAIAKCRSNFGQDSLPLLWEAVKKIQRRKRC